MERPFGRGITPVGGLANHSCWLVTKGDDPPSNGGFPSQTAPLNWRNFSSRRGELPICPRSSMKNILPFKQRNKQLWNVGQLRLLSANHLVIRKRLGVSKQTGPSCLIRSRAVGRKSHLSVQVYGDWAWPSPSSSGKWKFIGIHYKKCNNHAGHCYWGATPKGFFLKPLRDSRHPT